MTRRVEILIDCDLCPVGESAPAVGHLLVIDGAKPKELDLCDVHAKESGLDALIAALSGYGRTPLDSGAPSPRKAVTVRRRGPDKPNPDHRKGNTPAGDRVWLCPWCRLDYAATSGLRSHIEAVHGLDTTKLMTRCPACNVKVERLGHHSLTVHALRWTDLYREALAEGDPHGVLAPIELAAKRVAR